MVKMPKIIGNVIPKEMFHSLAKHVQDELKLYEENIDHLEAHVEKLEAKAQKDMLKNYRDIIDNLVLKGMTDFTSSFQGMISEIHSNAQEKGWWDEERATESVLCLIHCEISEAVEALRDGDPEDKHLPQYTAFEVELADAVIRIMDLAGKEKIDLGQVILDKHMFNKTRPYKHGKKF